MKERRTTYIAKRFEGSWFEVRDSMMTGSPTKSCIPLVLPPPPIGTSPDGEVNHEPLELSFP